MAMMARRHRRGVPDVRGDPGTCRGPFEVLLLLGSWFIVCLLCCVCYVSLVCVPPSSWSSSASQNRNYRHYHPQPQYRHYRHCNKEARVP